MTVQPSRPEATRGDPLRRAASSRTALWTTFVAVHGWLAWLGVVVMPTRAFWDVDLYRWWASLALDAGRWPVLDDPWVYPAGALVPVLAPALTGARTTVGYSVGWCVLVTVLDAVAVAVLLRAGPRAHPDRPVRTGRDRAPVPTGAWWWLAFLLALGPVALGRLDAVVAPLCVVALAVGLRRPRVAAALLTAGAWVKVAPGALLLPLAAVVRRPVRTVALPAAAVTAVVVGAVAAGGGAARIAGFVTTQGGRGLQVESVTATPWLLAAAVDERVRIVFDTALVTWEVAGPGTAATARALAVALPVALLGLAVLLRRSTASPVDVLLRGSLAATTVLLVVNAVGSPQLVGWLAAPVAVALTVAPERRAWTRVAAGVLVLAALTQVVFPFGADGVVTGDPLFTAALVLRNAGLVVLLVVAVRSVSRPAP
ncbi:hypothetical protein [uncultured Cellulomonas sp.]|uniref:hypothetical protein n=1 Tax=uncultured Cellulomonas sp. TaxID=189682 RepID=UPI0026346281|nr:hypothetical protein [uncultured Cellulomonas sp.]